MRKGDKVLKFVTSYFYKIRFFTPNMIPLSTAIWDPQWFHDFKGQQYTFFDKNGVINGLRAEMLHPGPKCEGLCHGREGCAFIPSNCAFLKEYAKQLQKVDMRDFLLRAENISKKVQEANGFIGEPIIVLLVHEATNNPCSERMVLQTWMRAWGIECAEWLG